MLLTEKEAKEKYCWRTIDSSIDTADSYGNFRNPSNCRASECMAWRWSRTSNGCQRVTQVGEPGVCPTCNGVGTECPECEGAGTIATWEPVGYCGMAGKPETT
jgi:hypothetical protein